MFKKFKEKIKELAGYAVNYAENKLATSSGKEKKQAAIAFIVERLEFPPMFKPFVIMLFTRFIDNAIEKAVEYMNRVRNED